MSITDELRLFAADPYTGWVPTDKQQAELRAIADRIDAEHEKALAEQFKALTIDMKPMTDENMAADGWIRLPKDADGETIHVGDAVTCGATVWTVTGLKFLCEGWGICCTVYNEHGGSGTSVYPPCDLHHYHAPTVEDVLREMRVELDGVTALYVGEIIDSDERDCDEARIFAEYAAKLRLAGDAE